MAALLCLTGSGAVCAPREGTVIGLIDLAGQDENFKSFVIGAGRALEGVNAVLEKQQKPRLYCPPGKLAITGDQYVRILSNFVAKNPEYGKLDINLFGFVLVEAAIDVFPCK